MRRNEDKSLQAGTPAKKTQDAGIGRGLEGGMLIPDELRRYFMKGVSDYFLSAFVSIVAVAACFFFAQDAFSAQATLNWNPPGKKTDGTSLTDLAGYRIYYGTASGNYAETIDVGNITTSVVSNLADGTTYYFAVTAYDTSGGESGYSNEVSKTTQGVQQYSLAVTKSGSGSGSVTSSTGGINCGATCTATYDPGAVVTLTAASSGGSTFGGWSGGGCTGTGTCSLSMNSSISVSAAFTANTVNTYSITATAGTGGSISPAGTVAVTQGAARTFTIAPYAGYTLADVVVDGTSVGAISTYTFSSVGSNHTIAAAFDPDQVSCGNDPIKSGSNYYTSLQAAYDASRYRASIQIIGTSLNETATLDRSISLSLQGGYDCNFASSSLYSIIDGALIISQGSVVVDNIIIR
jgi:hypothetical protein